MIIESIILYCEAGEGDGDDYACFFCIPLCERRSPAVTLAVKLMTFSSVYFSEFYAVTVISRLFLLVFTI